LTIVVSTLTTNAQSSRTARAGVLLIAGTIHHVWT
jgi:hypothetical protein